MSRFPADWPQPGPLDLGVHDLPHRSSTTEWWYMNTHFQSADGRRLSPFAAFFRIVKGKNPETKQPEYAHSVTWALSDLDNKTYVSDSRVDPSAPQMGLDRIKQGRGSRDPRLNRAIAEILARGHVPAPDRIFDAPVYIGDRRLELDFGGARFAKTDEGSYHLQLANETVAIDLTFVPGKTPARHGDDGVVRGVNGEEMFYYFIPRCQVAGAVTLDGRTQPVIAGQGWYDHEFGGFFSDIQQKLPTADADIEKEQRVDIAWNWAATQLDDGTDISAYALVRVADGQPLHQWVIVSDPDGQFRMHKDMTLKPLESWRSKRMFNEYPTRWQLTVPAEKLELSIEAAFVDQEFLTTISKPAFWEGRTEIVGSRNGHPVHGVGYVERSGFESVHDLDEFFSAVGKEVRAEVAKAIPLDLTREQAENLIASEGRGHYVDGVDLQQLSRALLEPIRAISDRGGKSWRSYAALAACDVVGGDSRKYLQWLATAELMHVGSLIVDDVQDRSTVRRGGPAAHITYGEPLAINAGTAAYFVTERLLRTLDISPAARVRCYELFFEVMRAGHAGQALDIDSLHGMLPAIVESGDATLLESRVLATHRLKAGVPAGCLARMGALCGGGTEAQIEAVGRFFESLGLAFQIVDDVLNLRGFKGNLKSRGEDVTNGTITLPVATAMGRLDRAQRQELFATLASKPTDPVVVSSVVERLETCGAIQACADRANELVESAWRAAEPLLADSISKVMLRAFGWYVLERHY
ncbi:MAG TPA: polyprenyl synthetase family protein [Polyangia bacterium]|nr:polyprenyl synthetase family protein [Polyangia bacterium]